MTISKHLCVAAFALLLILTELISVSTLASSTVPTSNQTVNSIRTTPYGDLLQYEWPQFQGDSASARFSAGPAPEAPDILWKMNLTGIQSYITAFNGMVFVVANTTVFALDRDLGRIIWNTTVPSPGRWPVTWNVDDTHMMAGSSCLDIASGNILWTSRDFTPNSNTFSVGVYSPEEKMYYAKYQSFVKAWDFSDPTQPPTLIWSTYVSGGGSVGSTVQYGDGKVFTGSLESHQMALDAKNGSVLWDTETKSAMLFSGSYSDGKFFRGAAYDNTFYAFDADTGKIVWTFNPGTYGGYWCVGSAVGYGMVYGLNKDGNLYALDENTGKVVWQYKGPGPLFFPGNPIVADGKIYATTGQRSSFDPVKNEYSQSEFVCLDVFTGQPIWKLPIEAYPPRESTAIAYGNLYLIPAYEQELEMDKYTTLNQVWAIGTIGTRGWAMWRHDPEHSGIGESGPTNLTLRWNFTTSGAVVSSPSVVNGLVYFGSQDKSIYCLSAQTGNLIWTFNTTQRVYSEPAVAAGKVYTGTDDGNVYCLDAYNGSLIWKTYTGGYVQANFYSTLLLRSSPIIVGNNVYVGALDNKTYCIDSIAGNIKWTYQTNGYIASSPASVDGIVYFVSQESPAGGLYQFNATNGDLIKRTNIPYQQTTRGTDLIASPTVAAGMIFVASNKMAYYGINATTGNITWTFKDPEADEFIVCSPIYNDGELYLIDEFYITSLNASSGKLLWKTFLNSELYVSPTYADGKLYVVNDQRSIFVINATDGKKISFFDTGSNSWSSPTLYGGKLFVGNNDWNVYCFSDYPALSSNITVEMDRPAFVLGESAVGSGYLTPGLTNASITVSFVKADRAVTYTQLVTSEKGAFNFIFTPDIIGNWTIVAQWQSDRDYYASASSEPILIEVMEPPTPTPSPTPINVRTPIEYVYVAALIAGVLALILGFVYIKRKKR
jgi:outer membrane protein assembly factor BamB